MSINEHIISNFLDGILHYRHLHEDIPLLNFSHDNLAEIF